MSFYLVKISEYGLRSALIILLLFTLPSEEASTLGFILSFLSIASFLVGYERYIDVQRTIAAPASSAREIFSKHHSLFLLHWTAITIPLSLIVSSITLINIILASAAILIMVSDHLATEYYRLSTITSDDRIVTYLSFIKYAFLISLLAVLSALGTEPSLKGVLLVWSLLSSLQIIHALIHAAKKQYFTRLSFDDAMRQYSRSATHFVIGLSAILSLQADRLLTNWLLASEAAQYYQHAFIAAGVYHVYSIGVLHPRLKHIYSGSMSYTIRTYLKTLFLPCLVASTVITSCVFALFALFDVVVPSSSLQVSWTILLILTVSYLLRSQADVISFYLNSIFKERYAFYAHCSAIASFIIVISTAKPSNLVNYSLVLLTSSLILLVTAFSLASRGNKTNPRNRNR